MRYCKTYADYVLFAIVLAITSLKGEYSTTAVKAMSMQCTDSYGETYENALDAYRAILIRRFRESEADFYYDILKEAYNAASNK